MNRAKFVLRRLRKFRSDRALRWVFPSINRYVVTTWRRINPRYEMLGGVGKGADPNFTNINCWNLIGVTLCRTHIGAILIQLLMGREKWTDGFRQQVVRISPPGSEYIIPPTGVTFDEYPTPDNPDLVPGVKDRLDMLDKYEQAEQVATDARKASAGAEVTTFDTLGTQFNPDGSVDTMAGSMAADILRARSKKKH